MFNPENWNSSQVKLVELHQISSQVKLKPLGLTQWVSWEDLKHLPRPVNFTIGMALVCINKVESMFGTIWL